MKPIVAVILCGGVGSRFFPITTDKLLFPFMGKKFIEHTIIGQLPEEVSKLVIVVSPSNEHELRSLNWGYKNVSFVLQKEPNGMAGALSVAEEAIGDNAMLILIADDLVDPGMYVKVVEMAKNNYYGVLPGWKPENYFPGGYLRLRTDGSVEGIDEKPGPGNEPSEYVNIGGHYIADAKDFFIQLKNTKSEKDDVYEKTLTELMKHNSFGVVSYEGKMASLKYPWHVLSITEQLLSTLQGHISKTASVDKTAKIDGNVFLSDGVRVFENAKITGPCYIGPNTIVGNGTMVRHSIIEHDSVLGYNSDIARSYIGSNTWLHSNYVGDSVIASNVGFGSGAVTANLRLDEEIIQSRVKGEKISTNRNKLGAVIGEGVRIGVQVSTMPGIKIGARSVIGPGVVVNADIPADTKVMLKQEVTMLSATSTVDSTNRQGFKDKI